MKRRIFLYLVGLIAIVQVASALQAQARSVFWNRWDVLIDHVNTSENVFRVTETYDVSFTGPFSFGTAVIPTDRLEHIQNVTVTQNGTPLRANCTRQSGTYCVSYEDGDLNIVYSFLSPIRDSRENIEITYDVHGALRSYEGGDQLSWDAIPTEHYGFPIGAATVSVVLPDDSAPREGIDPVVTYGAPADVQVNGPLVKAVATQGVAGDEGLAIRLQYPHDPAMTPPPWQAAFDRQFINLSIIGASLLIGLGGFILILVKGLLG